MTKDKEFLNTLHDSFKTYLNTHPSSTEKLKILHKKISEDFLSVLGNDYIVNSLGLNDDFGKEAEVVGKYYDKKVDITISKNNEHVAGIGVKFVMSNYLQNSNNYFENMMGETINLRLTQFKYYQIFVIFDRLPYFKNGGIIQKIEQITEHSISKYIKLDGIVQSDETYTRLSFTGNHSKSKDFIMPRPAHKSGGEVNNKRFIKRTSLHCLFYK